MRRGQVISSPDGDRWRVRRRWMNRSLPSLRRRFRKTREKGEPAADSTMDFGVGVDLLSGSMIGIAIVGAVLLVVFVLMPLIGIVLELIVLALFFGSSLAGRVLFRRPWTVEARNLDDPERSVAFAVKGYRSAGDAVAELESAIGSAGPPERLTAGERTVLPRPGV